MKTLFATASPNNFYTELIISLWDVASAHLNTEPTTPPVDQTVISYGDGPAAFQLLANKHKAVILSVTEQGVLILAKPNT